MNISKATSIIFGIIFIVVLYGIIVYALKIMYKDVKTGNRKKPVGKKNYAIEILVAGDNKSLEEGSIILLRGPITIGRKEVNTIVLTDQFVSGNHARITIKNNEVYLQDLNSTNGTFVDEEKIEDTIMLRANDKFEIGSAVFKVIKSDSN